MSTIDHELRAILFDRDDTLIVDVPYNADPDLVRAMPTTLEALRRVRGAGMRTGVVSNQSGVARGLLTRDDVRRVNQRVEEVLGAFHTWQFCAHGPDDGCRCRKPQPGLILSAAAELDISPAQVAVIGDIGADVEAATAAGARSVLVPTPRTRRAEIESAPLVAEDLASAVELLLAAQSVEVLA